MYFGHELVNFAECAPMV